MSSEEVNENLIVSKIDAFSIITITVIAKISFHYLQEDLPKLLIFMNSFIAGKDSCTGHADDVVDVDDLGGDVAEGCKTH